MKLKGLYIKNFRCFKDEIFISFDDITTIIGKNDIGKSTILEALEIFFNNDIVQIEHSDLNIYASDNSITIACEFCDLPNDIILDSGAKTSLKSEFLLTKEDTLKIKKIFDCSKSKITEEVFVVANHPTVDGGNNLLSLKEKDLQKIVNDKALNIPRKGNPTMRKAIWDSFEDLLCKTVDIPISKGKDDIKEIWEKIEMYIPTFALFQSDRSSKDSDDEVQNPMKFAIQEAIKDAESEIKKIQNKIQNKAMEIATLTHDALKEIDENLAQQITPKFGLPSNNKWNTLFSMSMETGEGIPLNKRGSGVRRMILVSFFKAEVDRKLKSSEKRNIIYAIEEPETSQHPNNQKILITSFLELSKSDNAQVILTTHSPNLAKELPTDTIRFVDRDDENSPVIKNGDDRVLSKIADILGLFSTPNKNIRLLICVEGPTDVVALKALSKCLIEGNRNVIDLTTDNRVAIIPLGGSVLKQWVEAKYLRNLNCPEIHIYDNDVQEYRKTINVINGRGDNSWATTTQKYEIENYLSSEAIKRKYGIDLDVDEPKLPERFAEAYAKKMNMSQKLKSHKAKKYLSDVFTTQMHYKDLEIRGCIEEVIGWFDEIKKRIID